MHRLTTEQTEQLIAFLCDENSDDIEMEYIQWYHIRISFLKKKKRLDYFPKKGRSTWVGSGRWFTIKDIEQVILNELK